MEEIINKQALTDASKFSKTIALIFFNGRAWKLHTVKFLTSFVYRCGWLSLSRMSLHQSTLSFTKKKKSIETPTQWAWNKMILMRQLGMKLSGVFRLIPIRFRKWRGIFSDTVTDVKLSAAHEPAQRAWDIGYSYQKCAFLRRDNGTTTSGVHMMILHPMGPYTFLYKTQLEHEATVGEPWRQIKPPAISLGSCGAVTKNIVRWQDVIFVTDKAYLCFSVMSTQDEESLLASLQQLSHLSHLKMEEVVSGVKVSWCWWRWHCFEYCSEYTDAQILHLLRNLVWATRSGSSTVRQCMYTIKVYQRSIGIN